MPYALSSHGARSMEIVTDYSGIDCPREALTVGVAGIQAHLADRSHKMMSVDAQKCCRFLRSCDIGALQQTVLQTLAKRCDDSSSCIHTNVEARLAPTARDWLDAAMPATASDAPRAFSGDAALAPCKLRVDLSSRAACTLLGARQLQGLSCVEGA